MAALSTTISRRLFLSLPAMLPLAAAGSSPSGEHQFSYEHVIGTSMDLVVWASNSEAAQRAETAVLEEIQRLVAILNTRDPDSEISRLGDASGAVRSRELAQVLSAYDDWAERTCGVISVRPRGANTPRNVDALGKAYIIERAADAAKQAAADIDGVLLNIGGDIVVRGLPCDIAIADPFASQDNGTPITWIRLHDAAIATSGTYARGAHLLDARSGLPAALASSASVVAPDAMTANALATVMCLIDADEAVRLVERTPRAHALRIGRDGAATRSGGFSQMERPRAVPIATPAAWPAGYEVGVSLTVTQGASKRPYVAVWVETASGTLVRVLAFWASKAKYFSELSRFWRVAGRDQNLISRTARATREPGKYHFTWDGLDEDHKPVPPGTYRIFVETNQEHGAYAKQEGSIVCEQQPATLTLPATTNFEPVIVQYGPKTTPA
jgi:thiamine biosynthesis lipoprotein ApbE